MASPQMNKAVLALDLGSTTGWAVQYKDGPIEFGHVTFEGTRCEKLSKYLIWLRNFLEFLEIDVVVFERPFARGQAATRMSWGLAGITEAMATINGAAVLDVHNSTVKVFAAKHGSAGKDAMTVACWAWGYDPSSADAADAICVLKYALNTMEVQSEPKRKGKTRRNRQGVEDRPGG